MHTKNDLCGPSCLGVLVASFCQHSITPLPTSGCRATLGSSVGRELAARVQTQIRALYLNLLQGHFSHDVRHAEVTKSFTLTKSVTILTKPLRLNPIESQICDRHQCLYILDCHVLSSTQTHEENAMTLMCPRCGTDVPTEVLYCPYCSLPKPKRGFVAAPASPRAEELPLESKKPAVAPKTATAKRKPAPAQNLTDDKPKSPNRTAATTSKQPRKLRVSVLSVAALVALLGIGAYIFVVPMVYSDQAEPKTILAALEKLRKTPSNEPGVTIDARLSRDLETSRRVKNLVSYQGWTVRPLKGTKSKVVLVFSYEEVGGVQQSAEWIADLNTGTFTPQTDLAAAVSIRESATK